jgi:hypothetical protein
MLYTHKQDTSFSHPSEPFHGKISLLPVRMVARVLGTERAQGWGRDHPRIQNSYIHEVPLF